MNITRRLLIITGLIVITGCTTARIGQFKQFADASQAYADAVAVLTREAGNAAIDADSLVLIKVRDTLSKSERSKTVREHNTLLIERLQLLRNISRQSELLKSYFVALSSLAHSDAPGGIGSATEGVIDSLGQISKKIRKAKVGDMAVQDFTGSVTNILVARFQRAELEKELKKRSAFIQRELDLQQAALQAIANQMKTDLEVVIRNQLSLEVLEKYKSSSPLPNKWSKKRKEILSDSVSLASADAAAGAAKNLKLSFVALSENRLQISDIEFLIKDINEILTLIEKIEGIENKNN